MDLSTDLTQKRPTEVNWLHQAWLRGLICWPVKVMGMTLVMTTFFVAYFWVLNHPLFSVTVMPLTFIDRLIAFQPDAMPLYLSLWFYVSLAPSLLITRREMISYTLVTIGLGAIGLGIFLVWPTTVRWPGFVWPQHSAFAFLKSVDAAGNACPSLHAAFAVFTAVWLGRLLKELKAGRTMHVLNWLWCLGILYSTIAIRQHVVLDVVAGTGLGAAVAMIHLRWLRAPI